MNNLVINAGGRFTPAHSKPRTAKRSYQKTYILGIKVLALNMRQNDTGLRHLVYISPNNCNSHHGPRIKVQYGYSEQVSKYAPGFSINVGRNPHVVAGDLKRVKKEVDPDNLEDIFAWVVINEEVLLKYWNNQINTEAVKMQLKPLLK